MTAAEIAAATVDDAAIIAQIHRAARAASMPWLRVVHTPDEDLAYFAGTVLPACEVWAARSGGAVLGFAARSGGWLEHLYVAPEACGQGLGQRLLERARSGRRRLELWTFQRNAGARRFYERHGFCLAELTDGARNEEGEPDARYVWQAF